MLKRLIGTAFAGFFVFGVAQAQTSALDFSEYLQPSKDDSQAVFESDTVDMDEEELAQELLRAVQEIRKNTIADVPISTLKAYISNDGELEYISSNGRYAFQGTLFDVWHFEEINTPEELLRSVNFLFFDNLEVDIEDLNTLSIHSKNPEAAKVVAFVDPDSASSRQLVSLAKNLSDEYTFHFVIFPAFGESSIPAVLRAACAENYEHALNSLEVGALAEEPINKDCRPERLGNTLVAVEMMGIDGVPFIVAPNGRISRGLQDNFGQWLKENKE